MTPQETELWEQILKLNSRIGRLEGMLIGVTCWAEVPDELKAKIKEQLAAWKEEDQ